MVCVHHTVNMTLQYTNFIIIIIIHWRYIALFWILIGALQRKQQTKKDPTNNNNKNSSSSSSNNNNNDNT